MTSTPLRRPLGLVAFVACLVLLPAAGAAAATVRSAEAGIHLQNLRTDRSGAWIAAGVRERTGDEGEGAALALVVGRADLPGRSEILAPPAVSAPILLDPEPLFSEAGAAPGDRLAGLAWLEGDDRNRLAVRFARRDGDGWAPAETVAPPGPGSQLALSAARLEDGTDLLLWSRFDGEDDEIVWSAAGNGTRWSPPRPIEADDAVPDVTPVVTAVPGGAVAAWSGFVADPDGTGGAYRVFVSRFDAAARTWGPAEAVAGEGSVLPSFETGVGEPAAPLLLVRTARPRGWTVIELSTAEAPDRAVPRRIARATAGAMADAGQRPTVAAADGAGVVLRWPSVEAAAEAGLAAGAAAGSPGGEPESPRQIALPWSDASPEFLRPEGR